MPKYVKRKCCEKTQLSPHAIPYSLISLRGGGACCSFLSPLCSCFPNCPPSGSMRPVHFFPFNRWHPLTACSIRTLERALLSCEKQVAFEVVYRNRSPWLWPQLCFNFTTTVWQISTGTAECWQTPGTEHCRGSNSTPDTLKQFRFLSSGPCHIDVTRVSWGEVRWPSYHSIRSERRKINFDFFEAVMK